MPAHGQTIAKAPRDTTARVGDEVQIDCNVNGFIEGNSFEWRVRNQRAMNHQLGDKIYQVPPRASGEPSNASHYAINGTYNLVIKQVTLDDGGWYACRLNNLHRTAHVVVMGEYLSMHACAVTNGCIYGIVRHQIV